MPRDLNPTWTDRVLYASLPHMLPEPRLQHSKSVLFRVQNIQLEHNNDSSALR